jgi:hypothetical protein
LTEITSNNIGAKLTQQLQCKSTFPKESIMSSIAYTHTDYDSLLAAIGLSVLIVIGILRYLRPVIQQVLDSVCEGAAERGAHFWLRVLDVLALSGTLLLVLTFGGSSSDVVHTVRITLLATMGGVFFSTVVIAIVVWRYAVRPNLLAEEYAAYSRAMAVSSAVDGDIATPAATAKPNANEPAPILFQ